MQIRNLRLTLDALSHGGPVILKSVAPDHEYDADNRRTDTGSHVSLSRIGGICCATRSGDGASHTTAAG